MTDFTDMLKREVEIADFTLINDKNEPVSASGTCTVQDIIATKQKAEIIVRFYSEISEACTALLAEETRDEEA